MKKIQKNVGMGAKQIFCGASVWSLCVLCVLVWIFSRYSDFLPQSKNLHFRLTDDSTLSFSVSPLLAGMSSSSPTIGVMDGLT